MSGGSTAMTGCGLDVANVGDGEADGVAVGVALAVGLGVALGVGLGVGEAVGDGVGDGVLLGRGESVTVGRAHVTVKVAVAALATSS
jgi:hypothetical protein